MSRTGCWRWNSLSLFFGLSVLIILTGCGGGGGSEGSNTSSPTSYTVSATAGVGGTISPTSISVNSGGVATFTVTANNTYIIQSVTGCAGSLSGNTFTTGAINGNCTVTASFDLKTYSVTATASKGGSITPGSSMVKHGNSASFALSTEPGYSIDTVNGCNGTLNGNVYTTGAVTDICEVKASFKVSLLPPQNLTVNVGNAELTLSWDNDTIATSYNLYYDTKPNIDPSNYLATNTGKLISNVKSPYKLSGLNNDTMYYAVVTSLVGTARSNASNEVSATPIVPIFTGKLNDTGTSMCGNDTRNDLGCSVPNYVGQDAEYGRDSLARLGKLTKVGGGAAGFDFTKLDSDGKEQPHDSTNWTCVKDNHSGLIWEEKTRDGGLRDQSNTYSWFDPNLPKDNGFQNGGLCTGSSCDTHAFMTEVNKQGLCGAKDWRVPTTKELFSLFNNRQAPTIDTDYFPNTPSSYFWTSNTFYARAYRVNFQWLGVDAYGTNSPHHVRLVRAGQ